MSRQKALERNRVCFPCNKHDYSKRKYSKLHVCLFWYVCHSVFVYFVLFCLQSSTILVYFTWFILTILILYFLFVACCFIDSIALHIYNLLGDTSLKKCLQFHFVVCIQFVTHFSTLLGNIRQSRH